MDILSILVACVFAYLIGSIPSSVWIGKIFYGIDVREYGSGNAGSTNTFRVLGAKAGVPVFLIDLLKGFLAAKLIVFFDYYFPGTKDYINFQILFGLCAVVGHIFPIYVGFRGGKGVATLLGLVFAVAPASALIAFGIFSISLLITRYVSLSSLIAGISFPILVIFVFQTTLTSLMVFSVVVSILVLLTHQKNIERLIRKEESKAKIFRRDRRIR